MQFRIYDRQTLAYKDGGYVASYTIDDDYIVNNNSIIKIVKELNDSVVVGDTIALIETSGAYHKGTITYFDNADFSIKYKADKELFNDNMLNPKASDYAQDEELKFGFDLDYIATVLNLFFGKTSDWAKALPLKVITEGTPTKQVYNSETEKWEDEPINMLWNWSNTTINIPDWLTNIFERYKVSVSWVIDFNIANSIQVELDNDGKIVTENGKIKIINNRNPFYVVTISAITNSGKLIKDNVSNLTITYTERELPEATVCVIIDKETKEVVLMGSGTKNLLDPNIGKKNAFLTVSQYSTNVEEKDDTSNISGYIKVNLNTTYTFSCKGYDDKPRRIVVYDKDRNYITTVNGGTQENPILSYNFGETSERQGFTFTFLDKITINDKEYTPAYVRICYYNKATELQFEANSGYTDFEPYNVPAIYYLINVAGRDMITLDGKDNNRIFPVKTKYVEFDTEGEDTTEEQTAYDTLIPTKFNQAIEIKISADSKMFDFENAMFGDLFKIINEQGTIDSNFTGYKKESGNKWVTLKFGLGRQNYTDLQQIKWRKSKYQVLYNQKG